MSKFSPMLLDKIDSNHDLVMHSPQVPPYSIVKLNIVKIVKVLQMVRSGTTSQKITLSCIGTNQDCDMHTIVCSPCWVASCSLTLPLDTINIHGHNFIQHHSTHLELKVNILICYHNLAIMAKSSAILSPKYQLISRDSSKDKAVSSQNITSFTELVLIRCFS